MPDWHRTSCDMAWVKFAGLSLLAVLAGCTEGPDHAALQRGNLPPLIQAHRFAYDLHLHGGYQISPDGSKLIWTAPSWGLSALHLRDNATGEVRSFRAGGGAYQWTPDGRWLLYTADQAEKENHHVYAIDTRDPDAGPVDLTPWPGVKAGIQQIPPADPAHILVYHNRRDHKVFDLYRIHLATRKETLVATNPGDATAPITTADGSFKGWKRSRAAQRGPEEARRPLAARRPALLAQPDETLQPLGLSADRSRLWALSNRGRDRIALVAVHPTLGWEQVVLEDPHVDVGRVLMSQVTRDPLVAVAWPDHPRLEILDSKLREDLRGLLDAQGAEPYGLDFVSIDRPEKRLVVAIYTSTKRQYYLVDREARTHTLLAHAVDEDMTSSLVAMRPVAFDSRDGLRLRGYLTLPGGVEARRLPMVLVAHGGPWLRTMWGDPATSQDALYAQFLANRGYAVLQVDFRGSFGYGRRFATAGMGEFAGRMQDDLLDAVRWAVKSGIADPERVAILGWSYGGYAALVGLTATPQTFACAVSINGPSDLASLIESFPPYWAVDLSRWHDYVGNPATPEDREQMRQKSPLHQASKAARPVLIVQGAVDVRVRVDQADRMVEALKRAGKEVEYLRIEDMGHGLGYWAHQLAVLRRTEAFLQRCLGGRASRFDPFDAVAWTWTTAKKLVAPNAQPAGNPKKE